MNHRPRTLRGMPYLKQQKISVRLCERSMGDPVICSARQLFLPALPFSSLPFASPSLSFFCLIAMSLRFLIRCRSSPLYIVPSRSSRLFLAICLLPPSPSFVCLISMQLWFPVSGSGFINAHQDYAGVVRLPPARPPTFNVVRTRAWRITKMSVFYSRGNPLQQTTTLNLGGAGGKGIEYQG